MGDNSSDHFTGHAILVCPAPAYPSRSNSFDLGKSLLHRFLPPFLNPFIATDQVGHGNIFWRGNLAEVADATLNALVPNHETLAGRGIISSAKLDKVIFNHGFWQVQTFSAFSNPCHRDCTALAQVILLGHVNRKIIRSMAYMDTGLIETNHAYQTRTHDSPLRTTW